MAYIKGTASNDMLDGTSDHDLIEGFAGNDTIYGNAGNDTLTGGDGNDILYGGAGNDRLSGGAGNDVLYGGVGADDLSGDGGDDTICVFSGEGYDTIWGGAGYDILAFAPSSGTSSYTVQIGYLSTDIEAVANTSSTGKLYFEVSGFLDLSAAYMADNGGGFGSINGSAGADSIYGSYLNDFILGNGGNDVLSGGKGADTIYGGTGADRFVFHANDGADLVLDYTDGTDKIRIWAPGAATSFADVTVSASGSSTQLDFAGTTVILNNVNPAVIDSSDFIFS